MSWLFKPNMSTLKETVKEGWWSDEQQQYKKLTMNISTDFKTIKLFYDFAHILQADIKQKQVFNSNFWVESSSSFKLKLELEIFFEFEFEYKLKNIFSFFLVESLRVNMIKARKSLKIQNLDEIHEYFEFYSKFSCI